MSSLFSRLLASLATLLAILFITFLLLHTVPGGPFDQERQLSPEIEENLYKRYGLHKRGDDGFWEWIGKDFGSYVGHFKKGELGPSLKFRDRDVSEIIVRAALPSLELGIYSLIVAFLSGIFFGLLTAARGAGLLASIVSFFSSLFVSFPTFVVAVFLVLLFAHFWQLLPPALWEGMEARILPVVSMALAPTAYFTELIRSGVTTQLKQDFIKTARAKGVPETMILLKHAFKNAATPVLTVMGPVTAALITGSFVVETIFAIPGLGHHFVTAVIDRDIFLVMGITLFYSVILIGLNWLVDFGYIILDPRMRKIVDRRS